MTVTYGFYAQHPQSLCHGSPLGVDKLPGPEGVRHFLRILSVLFLIVAECLLCQSFSIFPCLFIRRILGVDAVHIPSGRQHIRIQNRVTARCRSHASSVQGPYHIVDLSLGRTEQQLSIGIFSDVLYNIPLCCRQIVMSHKGIVIQLLLANLSRISVFLCHLKGQGIRFHGKDGLQQVVL